MTLPRLVIVFAIVACAQVTSPAAAEPPGERLHRAQIAYLEMEFDEAIEILERAIAACATTGCDDGEFASLHLMRGTVLLTGRGDEERARSDFRRGLELDQDVPLDLNYASPRAEAIFAEVRAAYLAERPAPMPDDTAPGPERAKQRVSERVVKWNRGFVEAGYSLTMASAHSNMRAASRPTLASPGDDPQLDAIPENDSFVLPGTRGCDAPAGEYCVRMTDGRMAFAHGVHLGGGYFITERFALGGRLRLNPAAGSGAMSHLLLGLRAYVQLTEPKREGFHALVYGGVMAGQIQVRPRQEPTNPGGDVARPWVRTGLGGFEVGAKLVHRVKPNVGLFAAPELYALFPHFSFGVQATLGVDVTFGEAEHVVTEALATEPAPAVADGDGDGVPDEKDRCPDEPEDMDGFEDEDGCPDPDDDGDGVPDDRDRCPREAEDMDGFEDEDGCPDRDNDGDGVFDDEDECPSEPGPALNEGCPIPDRDGDGVADRFDNCPDEVGSPENMGCPIPQLVQIEEKRIKILDSIYFRRNGHVIDRRSYELLDQLANVIREHPEIAHVRIEGHTDSTGSAAYNRKLSQRRAEAVLRYLVERGEVESHRLSAHGFGPDRPIHPDAETEEEHAENRRVEFVTLTE